MKEQDSITVFFLYTLFIYTNVIDLHGCIFFVPGWKPLTAVFPEISHWMTIPTPRTFPQIIREEIASNCHVQYELELQE